MIYFCLPVYQLSYLQHGSTALMWACKEGDLGITHYLVTQGADVNARDNVCCDMNDELYLCVDMQ